MKKKMHGQSGLVALLIAFVVVAGVIFTVAEMGKRTHVHAEAGTMVKMTTDQVREWVRDKRLAFVEFYSPECSACQMAEPVLKELVAELGLDFAYVDVRYPTNHDMMQELGVTATPTIFVFSGGEVVEGPVVGFLGEEAYREFFGEMLDKYNAG